MWAWVCTGVCVWLCGALRAGPLAVEGLFAGLFRLIAAGYTYVHYGIVDKVWRAKRAQLQSATKKSA